MSLDKIKAEEARWIQVLSQHPDTMQLSELIQWVVEHDPRYKGFSVQQLLERATGDWKQGWRNRVLYWRTGNSPNLRGFCIGCMERQVQDLVEQAMRETNATEEVALEGVRRFLLSSAAKPNDPQP